MDSGFPVSRVRLRNEADLYGYTEWLSNHLGVKNTNPRFGFQHMWIWWDLEPRDIVWALDPHMFKSRGTLIQNEVIKSAIRSIAPEEYGVEVCGLPFLNFIANHPVDFKRNGKTLYVSTHSTSWRDISNHTKKAVEDFIKDNDVTVLLSVHDCSLAKELKAPCLMGADAMDVNSFYRIQKIFSEYEYMITDRMGSHVLYGVACGMKVGLSAKYNIDTVFSETAIGRGFGERAKEIRTTKFLDDRFPGLVIENGLPSYTTMPPIVNTDPKTIASYIWS